jgi:hypothetical protein
MPSSTANPEHFVAIEHFRVRDCLSGTSNLWVDNDAADAEIALLSLLEGSAEGTLVEVDFSDTRVASEAARRLLKRALLRIRSGEIQDRFLVLINVDESLYSIHTMLMSESLTAVCRPEPDDVELIGVVEPAVQATYSLVSSVETATASMVAEHLQLNNISTATNRLTLLSKLGLARRVERRPVAGGGREYVYAAVR